MGIKNLKFIQVNCVEGDKIDLRQAKSIIKYKPNIILLEYPNNNRTPDTDYNKYKPENKPYDLLKTQQVSLEKHLKNVPWVKSDIVMWENIGKLWKEKHQVFVYRTDAPSKLVNEWVEVWKNMYPCAQNNWLWWVKIYLREKYMTRNIVWILKNQYPKTYKREKLIVLVFLQSFHWRHVKFLLRNPNSEETWKYYFGKFPEITKLNITEKIKSQNKVFFTYWNKIADFKIEV